MKMLLYLFFLTSPLFLRAQDSLTVVFVGDAMMHQQQLKQTFLDGEYSFDGYFDAISDDIRKADIAMVNLETTLGTKPYSGYPAFSSPPAFAEALREAGFDFFLLANNHCLDRGGVGVKRTLQVLDSLSIPHTGIFTDADQRLRTYPRLILKNDFRLIILNYTFGTNGIHVSPPYLINYIDEDVITADLAEAKRFNPDFILVQIHWGEEYHTSPSLEQRRLADQLFNQGADLIIGHHPHVVQPMELVTDSAGYGKQLVFYSLGNFVSNMSQVGTRTGAMVKVVLCRSGLKRFIASASYDLLFCDHYQTHDGKKTIRVVPALEWEDSYRSTSLLSDTVWFNDVKPIQTLLQKANQNIFE